MDVKTLTECFDLFHRIGGTPSRTSKEAMVQAGMKNEAFRTLVKHTYDPFLIYGIKKVPHHIRAANDVPSPSRFERFVFMLGSLNKRDYTGNAALAVVSGFLNTCNIDEQLWYTKVLQKDLKIGITDKTINKIEPGYIPIFECMLAHPLKKYPESFYFDRKLDGYRCLAFHYEDGSVTLFTRNGHVIEGYTGIEEEISERTPLGYVSDGEILERSGTFNATQSQVFKKGKNDKDGVLNIFDLLPIKEFEQGFSTHVHRDRYFDLVQSVDFKGASHLKLVYSYGPFTPKDIEEVDKLYQLFLEEGYEGGMVKDANGLYQCKRTRAVQKRKPSETIDLTIIDTEEGKDDFVGMLGALVVDLKGNRVNVGTGFSVPLRKELWARRNELTDKVIEIKYQEITNNKQGTQSLRFPVFVRFRDDK